MRKLLNEEQVAQLEKQLAAHQKDDYTVDLDIAPDLRLKEFLVLKGVLRPEVVTSIHFARWLYEQRDIYAGKHAVDMGSGSGIQGTVMAYGGARDVSMFDNSVWACANSQNNILQQGLENAVVRVSDLFETHSVLRSYYAITKGRTLEPFLKIDFCVFNHPFFAADGVEGRPEGALGNMLASPNLIHQFFEQAKEHGPIAMPSYLARATNDPGVLGRPEAALGNMLASPELIHRFFEQAKEHVDGPIAMPFYHLAPAWNDPGIVGQSMVTESSKHDRIIVTDRLQQGEVSFYLLG
jgi:hypothetical protein